MLLLWHLHKLSLGQWLGAIAVTAGSLLVAGLCL